MKKTLCLLLSLVLCIALCVPACAEDYTAAAKGFGGDVTVTLTIENGAIAAAKIEGAAETAGIGGAAIEKLAAQMVELNSVELDSVSGATVTSDAVLAAAVDALAQAGLAPADLASVEAAAVEAAKPAFENPDVIVIGAGSAGMNAAIAAAEAGAKVYLIEQNDATGGSIRYAGGTTSAAQAQMQIDAGKEDSPENFAADIERMGGGTNIPELTKKHTENAAAAVNWLDQVLGLDFGDRLPKMSGSYDAFNVEREYRVTGGGVVIADAVRKVLDTHIEAGSVSLLLNTRVDDIIIEEGAVVGVVIDDAAKTEYRADAIVLATGGYCHNEELLKRYNFDNVLTTSPSFVTGDGFIFAEKAGAKFNNMDYMPAYPGGVPTDGFDLVTSAYVTNYNNTIWVDLNGQRLVAEMGALDSERKAAYSSAEQNLVYIVFNQAVRDTQDSVIQKDEGWAKFDELLAAGNCVYTGATIEELAANAGLNAEGLAATIEKMNGFVDAGVDADFGRDMTTIAKIEEGPYYAVKTCPYVMLSKGGPVMNPDAQVLNTNDEPIPGLYECGELAGGANIGGSANIGGLANTSTIVWGKIAGTNAAAYAIGK